MRRGILVMGRSNLAGIRVCAKTSAEKEAYFEQHDSLPSDGRGNSQIRLLHHFW
jgi:hypothetical protein